MNEQELNNLLNYYYWFYSTITQSLAALIGIVGVFVIFRIQLLINVIENKTKDLQQLVNTERWTALGVLNPASIYEDMSISINKIIQSLTNTISNYENMIQKNIRNSSSQQGSGNLNEELQRKKQSIKDRINTLNSQKSFIDGQKALKDRITQSAKILIVILIVLLIGGIICLSMVEIICQSAYWSKTLIPCTVILLSVALYLLSRLCWISLKTEP